MGREQRQLALGDDMALVDAHEEAGLGLRRRHESQPFTCARTNEGRDQLEREQRGEGFRSAVAAAAGRGGGLPYLEK